MRSVLVTTILFGTIHLHAQVEGVPRDLIEQRIEAAAENSSEESDVDLTNLFEILTDHYLDPIDLNHTNAQELNSLLLLSDIQINSLLEHIRTTGKLISIYELQAVRGMDVRTIDLIRPFITVREDPRTTTASLKEMWKYATHEVILRSTMTIEERKGFIHRNNFFDSDHSDQEAIAEFTPQQIDSLESNSKVYLGSPYRIYSRYRLRYRQNVSLGFTVEKDEGEQFFRGTQRAFDHISGHFFLRDVGRFKAIAIGDHAAQFGQGLAFWNGLAFASKSSFTMNVKRNAVGLLPYTSVNENLFLRGAAATYAITQNIEVTGIFSLKKIDANVAPSTGDSLGIDNDVIGFSSFQADGFHRTYNELKKKDAIGERIIATHARYKKPGFSMGATFSHVEFSADLQRDLKPYNMFEFEGRRNSTAGIDWNVLHRNTNWYGEFARSANGGLAFNSGLLIALDRRVSLSLLYRNYDRKFQNLYSAAFAEGTHPWNERGLFTGIEIRANRHWTINAYTDHFEFPWLRYQVDAPSHGSDWLIQLNWKPDKRFEFYVRTRHQNRNRNAREETFGVPPIVPVKQIDHRVNATYRISNAITLRTRIQTVDVEHGNGPLEHGFLIYQDLIHRPLSGPLELTLRFALFETDGWNARIYAFENDLIGSFSIPPHYGRGTRWYFMLRSSPIRSVDLWLRYGAWIYRDQEEIGSGLQEISGNIRSDVRAQIRWSF